MAAECRLRGMERAWQDHHGGGASSRMTLSGLSRQEHCDRKAGMDRPFMRMLSAILFFAAQHGATRA